MISPSFFEGIHSKITQAIGNSPVGDIEKNVKAILVQGLSKLDLVTREEFEEQSQLLASARAKLELLETQLDDIHSHFRKNSDQTVKDI